MSVTTVEGIVKDGKVVIPEGFVFPESALVYVVVPDVRNGAVHVRSPRLVNKTDAKIFKKVVEDVTDDEI